MRLVYSFRIDQNDKEIYPTLKEMSKVSKDLYNQALFEVKARFQETGEILSYPKLDRIMKTKTNLEGSINYRLLPSQVSQQTLRLVDQNIKSFFKARADYQEKKDKYLSPPQFPNFLPKDGHFVLAFTNQKAKINTNGVIQLKRDMVIHIPEEEFEKYQQYFIKREGKKIKALFNQVRIVPKFNAQFFNIEIVYHKDEVNEALDINRYASVDIGVNNLITLIDTAMAEEDRPPQIVNGRPIKSINQFYNKKRAFLQSSISQIGKKVSHALSHLTDWRNEKINDYMHKASRFVVNHCLDNNVGQIVIGKNNGWKREIHIGKRNNQNFVSIPFDKLIKQIQYKAQLVGIKVTITEESYTSKCSALDLEAIGKHEDHAYAGKRVKRGLFRTSSGLLINADVNGALNILRKVIGDIFLKVARQKATDDFVLPLIPSRGYLCYPIKVCF